MKFCQYTWTVCLFAKRDAWRTPIEKKEVVCELEHGHLGPHKNGKVTSPNIRSREKLDG